MKARIYPVIKLGSRFAMATLVVSISIALVEVAAFLAWSHWDVADALKHLRLGLGVMTGVKAILFFGPLLAAMCSCVLAANVLEQTRTRKLIAGRNSLQIASSRARREK